MAEEQTSGGWVYDDVVGVKVDKATALNGQSRVLEIKQVAVNAQASSTKALATTKDYAGQIQQANADASEAKSVVRDELQPQVDALNTAAGYAPGDATDAAMANVGSNPDTQFRDVLNTQSVLLAERAEFNVLDYGALGDWNGSTGTDNLAAFNAVAALVKSTAGPSRIVIPAGDYWISNNWLLDGENVEVVCDLATTIRTTSATLTGQAVAFMGHGVLSPNNVSGPQRERFIWRGGRIVAEGSGTMDNALGVVRVKNCHVADVSLWAGRKGLTAQYGIDNITWERVTVEWAGVDGVTVETACHRVALRDVHVVEAQAVGVLVTSGSASERNADVVLDNVNVDRSATGFSLGLTDRVSMRAVKSFNAGTRDLNVAEVSDVTISTDSHLDVVRYGSNVTHKKPRRQSITLGGGWTAFGAPHNTPSVYVTSDGMAVLSGAIKGGTTAVGTGFGTLPVGALPAYRERFMVQNAGGSGSAAVDVYIDPSGSMIFGGAAPNNTIVSLSGITYPVA